MGRRWTWAALCIAASATTTGCEGDFFYICPVGDQTAQAQLPVRLSDTGLYEDIDQRAVATDARAYRPQFELWSDGADKQRWIQLPPGARIDTTDMDSWTFPEGTRVWKEFARDGVPIETRLLEKIGPTDADWAGQAYAWAADGSDAIAAPDGFVDAAGTSHDVPAAGECRGCHGGRRSYVLGFSAIQLSSAGADGELDLAELIRVDLLSAPPAGPFTIPGDDTERAALGYLHANCGHCHNQARPSADVAPCFDPDNRLDLWLRVDRLSAVAQTPAYESAIGFAIEPGDPDASKLIDRVTTRRLFYRMPPLGSEAVDGESIDLLRRWISAMP